MKSRFNFTIPLWIQFIALSLLLYGCGQAGSFSTLNKSVTSYSLPFLVVADPGTHQLVTYHVGSDGTLTAAQATSVPSLGNYAAAHPTRNWVYALATSTTLIRSYTLSSDGSLTEMANSPTTATTGHEFLAVEPKGRFLYAPESNSTSGIIDVYSINQTTGALTAVSSSGACGNQTHPEMIAFDPQGKYAYAAGQGWDDTTDAICGFSIDQTTGALTSLPGSPYLLNGQASGPYGIVVTANSKYVVAGDTGNTWNWCTQCISGFTSFSIGSDGSLTYLGTLQSSVYPIQMTVDANGNILAADAKNHKTDLVTLGSDGIPNTVTILGEGHFGLAVDPTGSFAYSTHGTNLYQYQIDSGATFSPLSPASFSDLNNASGLTFALVPQ